MNGESLGYTLADIQRLRDILPDTPKDPAELARIIDWFDYLVDWREDYKIQSVRSSIHSNKITCIDAAILAYGLLELYFPKVKRRLLSIHRKDMHGEQCGHCVALYWGQDGRVGAFSKSSFKGFGHRAATFLNEDAVALSFAEAYLEMKFTPLYYGVSILEEIAPDLDWRFSKDNLNVLASRLIETYQYGFDCG